MDSRQRRQLKSRILSSQWVLMSEEALPHIPELTNREFSAENGILLFRMKQAQRKIRNTRVQRVFICLLILISISFVPGCRKRRVIVKDNSSLEQLETEKPAETPQPKATSKTSTSRRRVAAERVVATPTPTPTPTPVIDYTPIVIEANRMATDRGKPDPAGGKILTRNGFLQIDGVEVPFPIGEVVLEIKGSPAGNIWPEVDLNMYNRTVAKNFFPWPRDYVTTNTFHRYSKTVNPPMPPGKYLVTFRYYNDGTSDNPAENRAVTLKSIEIKP